MNKKSVTIINLFILGLGFLIFSQSRADVNDYVCGSLQNGYGPYDYRSDKDKLRIVEQYHLTPEVVNLVSGATGAIGGDLDYTLRAFPNHHVALMAMAKLGEKQKTAKPTGAKYGVECYFQRAIRFRNDDEIVRILYASYLSKAGKRAEALSQLNEAAQLGSDSANANYNMGLIFFDLKEYDKALSYAHTSLSIGVPIAWLTGQAQKGRKMEGACCAK